MTQPEPAKVHTGISCFIPTASYTGNHSGNGDAELAFLAFTGLFLAERPLEFLTRAESLVSNRYHCTMAARLIATQASHCIFSPAMDQTPSRGQIPCVWIKLAKQNIGHDSRKGFRPLATLQMFMHDRENICLHMLQMYCGSWEWLDRPGCCQCAWCDQREFSSCHI